MDVKDKVTIITGASMGIGEATARVFAEAGAKLVLVARSGDKLQAVADSLPTETLVITADMTSQAQVNGLIEKAYEHFGQIDILINNAGQAAGGPVATVNPDHYRQIIDLNLFGPLYAIQAVVPKMKEKGGGIIINISSNVSKMALPNIGAYASTKYALNGLSLTARNELAGDNIRVILFHPGLTATDFGKNALKQEGIDYGSRPPAGVSESNWQIPTPDSVEDVAKKFLEAADTEPAEMGMPMRNYQKND